MEADDARTYRRIAARANVLAQDRPGIQFAVKESARFMSRPTRKAWQLIKRLGRYLKLRHRFGINYQYQTGISSASTHGF